MSKSIRINSVNKLIIVIKHSVKKPSAAKISIPEQNTVHRNNNYTNYTNNTNTNNTNTNNTNNKINNKINNKVDYNDTIYCDDELIKRIIKNGGL